jgi:hypothetical protein
MFILGHSGTRHGHHRNRKMSSEYSSWFNAKQRCTNPKRECYKDYGGRGIKFLFDSFEAFYKELGPKPLPKHLYSVHRIDNNGNYEPGNVKWATRREQAAHQRRRLGKSGYEWITAHTNGKGYFVRVKRNYLGYFTTLRKAIAVRNAYFKNF